MTWEQFYETHQRVLEARWFKAFLREGNSASHWDRAWAIWRAGWQVTVRRWLVLGTTRRSRQKHWVYLCSARVHPARVPRPTPAGPQQGVPGTGSVSPFREAGWAARSGLPRRLADADNQLNNSDAISDEGGAIRGSGLSDLISMMIVNFPPQFITWHVQW